MIQNTLAEIEARLRQAESVKPETRDELLNLLGTLRSEMGALAKTHSEQAESIAGFTTVSAHEATRGEKNPELVDLVRVPGADHVESWNVDPADYQLREAAFLTRVTVNPATE